MKQRGWPLWLLRDVRAFTAVLLSFGMLMIVSIIGSSAMRNGRVTRKFLDRLATHLAIAEAWLDWAFWRQAHRRLGLDHRAVKLHLIPPTTTSRDTLLRWQLYSYAFQHMQQVVDSHVETLRQRYRISAREAHMQSHPLRLAAARRSASSGYAGGGAAPAPLASLSRLATGGGVVRASCAHDGGGLAFARGPPSHFQNQRNPPRRHLRERARAPTAWKNPARASAGTP